MQTVLKFRGAEVKKKIYEEAICGQWVNTIQTFGGLSAAKRHPIDASAGRSRTKTQTQKLFV